MSSLLQFLTSDAAALAAAVEAERPLNMRVELLSEEPEGFGGSADEDGQERESMKAASVEQLAAAAAAAAGQRKPRPPATARRNSARAYHGATASATRARQSAPRTESGRPSTSR